MSSRAPQAKSDLASYRQEFPVSEQYVYLNHAGVSPAPVRVSEAVTAWMMRLTREGMNDEMLWEEETEICRRRFAALIGAAADEIAFVRNTSHGLCLVAEGLDWQPGDRVAVAADLEYPSNVYPWQNLATRGVAIDPIHCPQGAVTIDAVTQALGERTRLLAVSSAQFGTGAVTDLAALGQLCRQRDVLLCVDGIQTVGAVAIDVKALGIHFLAADSHKWLLGMCGIGALYVDAALIERMRPVLVGWKSTTDPFNFDRAHFELVGNARRFEEGSPAYALIAGFNAALSLIEEVSIDRINAHVIGLVERLARKLDQIGCDVGPSPAYRQHILTFVHPQCAPETLLAQLAEHNFVLSMRQGRLRVSPHFYNSAAEIDRLVTTVSQIAQKTR